MVMLIGFAFRIGYKPNLTADSSSNLDEYPFVNPVNTSRLTNNATYASCNTSSETRVNRYENTHFHTA
jgi:hypothetical protein